MRQHLILSQTMPGMSLILNGHVIAMHRVDTEVVSRTDQSEILVSPVTNRKKIHCCDKPNKIVRRTRPT